MAAMQRPSILSTSPGTRSDAFGVAEWGLLSGIALIWGSSFVLIAFGLDAFQPGLITLLRIAFGAAALSLVPAARARVHRSDWPRLVVLGLTWMAVPLLLFPVAQQWIDSSLAGMINGSMPLFSALVAALLLRRFPGTSQVTGLMVGFGGVVAISWPAVQGAGATARGAALVLVATALYGVSVNLAVPLQQRYGSLPVLLRVQAVAVAATLPFGIAAIPGSAFAWGPLAAVVALGVFGTGLAFVAMATLAGRVGATRGSIAIYFLPVVAIAFGVAFRAERVEPIALVGTGLVLLGAYLASRQEA